MKLRIICREEDCVHVVNGGASRAETSLKTFDVEVADDALLNWLLTKEMYRTRSIDGVEVIS